MTRIKICGITRDEDAAFVNRYLPEYVGFVFAESRRKVSIDKAGQLKEKLNPCIQTVGVFVDHDIREIIKLCESGVIDCVQLHGNEDGRYIEKLGQSISSNIIKAIPIADSKPSLPPGVKYYLFDKAGQGGSGMTFDWTIIKDLPVSPFFLAGGLNCGNVTEAIEELSPYCVDVSSGVETGGFKDEAKIREFIRLVREK